MKKLFLVLFAAALMLLAAGCGEKTKTYTYENLQFTYPASWEMDASEDEYGVVANFQDDKEQSNSLVLQIMPLDMDAVNAATPEELKDFLQENVEDIFRIWVTEDDGYVLSFQSELKATDTQAMLTCSGTAYDEPFTGTFISYMQDEYCFTAFISAKSDSEYEKVANIMNYELL